MTPKALSARFRRAATLIHPAFIAAEAVTVKEAAAAAIRQSSGTSSTKALRQAGHPFAVRAPNPAFDPAVINSQSGSFRAAWIPVQPSLSGSKIVCGVVNRDRAAKYLSGTRTMIPRTVGDAVRASVASARRARIVAAVKVVLTP